MVGKPRPDELNRGFLKVNIAFTLPPGSYATLVVKRLFHFGVKKETIEEITPRAYPEADAPPQISKAKIDHKSGEAKKPRHRNLPPKDAVAPIREKGFLEKQREAKKLKASRRMDNTKR